MHENEKFYPTIIQVGDSIGVTIPHNIVKGVGFKVGDEVVVLIRKKEKE